MTILTWDRSSFILQQKMDCTKQEGFSTNWYNPIFKCITNIRLLTIKRTVSLEWLQQFIALPGLRIYTVVSHAPIGTDDYRCEGDLQVDEYVKHQRVNLGEMDYVDEFGQHVYVVTRIGYLQDVDLRYDEGGDPDLFTMQLIEHDLPNRKGNGAGPTLPDRGVGMVS